MVLAGSGATEYTTMPPSGEIAAGHGNLSTGLMLSGAATTKRIGGRGAAAGGRRARPIAPASPAPAAREGTSVSGSRRRSRQPTERRSGAAAATAAVPVATP